MDTNTIGNAIRESCQLLKEGKTLLYPSDTIWGLGCDATNAAAVEKIFDIKNRPSSKSLIVLVSNDGMLERYVKAVPEIAWEIIDNTNKPTTIVYPEAKNLAPNLIAEDGSIAIRIVKEGFCHRLIHQFNRPLVSTSANISGSPSPLTFEDIEEQITSKVDAIVGKEFYKPGSRLPQFLK